MKRFMCALSAVSLLAGSFVIAGAAGDGLPVLGVDVGGSGVVTGTGGARYVTIPAGAKTLVARVQVAGGRVESSRLLRGTFTIPAVAYDGSASGLSADGGTLVLIEPRVSFPRAETTLLALDARTLSPRRRIRLRGDFSFDAISPGGGLAYLIEYVSPRDPTRYRVRAFDLRSGRLLPQPVVDATNPGEQMRGSPLSRASGADGRWAYTLYDGGGGTPFLHALDTSSRSARCIDLDSLNGTDLSQARLTLSHDGRTLAVSRRRKAVVRIDTVSFRTSPGSGHGDWLPFLYAAVGIACASSLLALGLLRVRRRRELALAH